MSDQYVIGIDFGTLSGRALVVRASDGEEIGSAVHAYRHAVIDETLGDELRVTVIGTGFGLEIVTGIDLGTAPG